MPRDVPVPVQRLVDDWHRRGCPPQEGMEWPRLRWLKWLERQREVLDRLPDVLDRSAIRHACADATRSPEATEAAFITVMVWGYGGVGYGPSRVARILAINRGVPARLQAVVRTLRADGPERAYARFADSTDCRLHFLGPAFGTKVLAFFSVDERRPALILDSLVGAWLRRNAGLDLDERFWAEEAYSRYLAKMYRWAELLEVRSDDLECQIFSAEAAVRRGR